MTAPALPGLGPPHCLRLRPTDRLWGIDSDTKRVSIAFLVGHDDGGHVLRWATQSLPGSAQSPVHLRQSGALQKLVSFVHWMKKEWGVPSLVAVEEPFTENSKSGIQDRSLGVLLAALGLELGIGTDVRLMGPGEWKLPATGSGYRPGIPALPVGAPPDFDKREWAAARKVRATARRVAEKARLMEWARQAGYIGDLQDEADAVGVVVGAAVMLEARRAAGP